MHMETQSKRISATELLRADVYNRDQQILGQVQDVVVDADEGLIIYIYLCLEGVERVITVPWSAFEVSADHSLVLDVSVKSLQAASH